MRVSNVHFYTFMSHVITSFSFSNNVRLEGLVIVKSVMFGLKDAM